VGSLHIVTAAPTSTRWHKSLGSVCVLTQFLRSPGIVRYRLYVAKIGCKMVKTTPQTGIWRFPVSK